MEAPTVEPGTHRALTDDGGRRYDAFWEWVDSRTPDEPLWLLDSIAVAPTRQGQGARLGADATGCRQPRRPYAGISLDGHSP